MTKRKTCLAVAMRLNCAVALLGVGGLATIAAASPPSGVSAINYTTETLEEGFKAEKDNIELKTKAPTIVRTQLLTFAPNSTTGWHQHPGVVIVAVESGTLTLWDTDCSKEDYTPGGPNGAVFTEAGDHAHQATSTDGALVRVTYIVPSTGAVTPANFRIEENVPFCASSL